MIAASPAAPAANAIDTDVLPAVATKDVGADGAVNEVSDTRSTNVLAAVAAKMRSQVLVPISAVTAAVNCVSPGDDADTVSLIELIASPARQGEGLIFFGCCNPNEFDRLRESSLRRSAAAGQVELLLYPESFVSHCRSCLMARPQA